jgi:hypothetical protein
MIVHKKDADWTSWATESRLGKVVREVVSGGGESPEEMVERALRERERRRRGGVGEGGKFEVVAN